MVVLFLDGFYRNVKHPAPIDMDEGVSILREAPYQVVPCANLVHLQLLGTCQNRGTPKSCVFPCWLPLGQGQTGTASSPKKHKDTQAFESGTGRMARQEFHILRTDEAVALRHRIFAKARRDTKNDGWGGG